MHPRSMLALGVGALAATVALALGIWKQVGVKSYGHPAGRVVRAGQHLGVVIETRDPYMPSLKGVSEQDLNYSYELWLIPETCDGDVRTIRVDRGVRSSSRTHNIGAQHFESGLLWFTVKDLQAIEVASGERVTTPPPASLVNKPISALMGLNENPLEEFRAKGTTLPSGDWLFLANADEVSTALKPGTRLFDNSTASGTYKPRSLHIVTTEPGPIPRVANVTKLTDRQFRNGAFMRSARAGSIVRFTSPDGFLIVHEEGDPVHPTICLSRVNVDGTIAWTADTEIGRLTQILPHDTLPAFVGELPQQLTEPLVAVVDLSKGTARTRSLKGPLN